MSFKFECPLRDPLFCQCAMATGSIPVLSKSYTFDPRPLFPYRIVANRYWIEEFPYATDRDTSSKTREDVLTLVFMHGNGAHKELGGPMILRLFQNEQTAPRSSVRFHDMWSLDMPNQGDSAILNEETLRSGYDICKIVHCHNHEPEFPFPFECMQSHGNSTLEASMPS